MPKANYFLTPDAQADLINIRQYTFQQWGRTQSYKYLSELKRTICFLAESPSLGKHRPDVGENVQSFTHKNHVIYYYKNEHRVVIFGILHSRIVPENHLQVRQGN